MAQQMQIRLPHFRGATRKLVLWNVVSFFAFAVLAALSPALWTRLSLNLVLVPALVLDGHLWQLVTYGFVNFGVLTTFFALLTLWFTGSMLEAEYGARWIYELYFTSLAGGGLIAAALSYTRLFGLSPLGAAAGAWAGVFGLLVAIASRFGEQEFRFFLLTLKARYLVAIYLLVELALLVRSSNPMDALVQLSGALAGYAFLRLAPRRGLAFGLSERYYSLRNAFYKSKRRRAARQFEVYMGKQNLVDKDKDKDPNDKRWMN